ncbi:DNA repair protein RAD50, partial [Phenoliferia sp. Uapishka_3]
MSSLDKLAIRGIRSFDHNDIAVIQFYTPLTVIVGHNGSGKTTIIECLKYATTGDLPPNTKGGAFVHDPSIAGTSEVKASVKLRFFNTSKDKMVVERRLQVTKKKGAASGLTMKTLEGTISLCDKDEDRGKKNKRTSLSTKCAALDEEVPRQLGVSKAILENVIFCHQEESNWPLSEPAALKKKFDDIFEATKYTKALDQIKVLRKEQAIEIKVDKEKLAALKTDRDRAIRLRITIEKASSTIVAKQAQHDELEAQIRKVADDNRKFYTQAAKHSEILGQHSTLQTQRKLTEDQLNQLRAIITELKDVSDHELQKKIANHKTDLDGLYSEKVSLNERLTDEKDGQEKQEKKRSIAQTNHGNLQAQKDRYDDNLVNRLKIIQEIATRHEMSGWDHDLTTDEVAEFVEQLEARIAKQGKKIEDIKTEGRKNNSERQSAIQAIKITKSSDERARSATDEQIRSLKSRISDINRKLDNANTTSADITMKESALEEEKKRKMGLEDSVKAASYPEMLTTKSAEARALEEKRDALHVELTSLNLQADVRAKLQLKRTESKRKDDAIQSLIDSSRANFKRIIKLEPTRATMEGEVNAVAKVLDADIRAADKSLVDARRVLTNVETSVNLTKKKLKELQDASAAAKRRVQMGLQRQDTECETVEAAMTEAEQNIAEITEEVKSAASMTEFYQSLIDNGRKHKKCVGCDRGLSGKELASFETYCKARINNAPEKVKTTKAELKQWEEQMNELKGLLPHEVSYDKLQLEDIPAAEQAAAEHAARLPAATAETERASGWKSELEAKSADVQLLRKTAQDVVRMHRETEEISRDIVKLESELSASGSTATSDDIQEQLATIGTDLRAASKAMDKLRTDSQKMNQQIQSLTNSIHTIELDLNKKRQELRDKEALEKRKDEANGEITALEEKRKELERKIRDAEAPLRKLEDEANEAQRQYNATEALASRELQGFHKSAETLDNNAREIKQFETRGVSIELAKVERDLKLQEKAINETKARVQKLQNDISKADKALADSNAVLRNFNDNQQFRRLRREIEVIDGKIDELDVASAEKAHRTYEAEYNVKRKKQADLSGQQAKLGGEVSTLENDLTEKRGELKSEYDNIDEKYKTELIKVKTAEVANLDLEKYGKALDAAIMSFHGVKMKEINDTIADLWTKTYQGTDIDKIMIKSEGEGKNGKSYNYRVAMQKDNTEMDMRGRCSAGQKVLASIIIRLALAESFGMNCGILALDEPTTNLDQANIKALASALADLINEKKGQSNFQLLIITHDEEFLNILGGNGVLDRFWRVSRGDGGQVSTIVRQKLS